MRALCAVAPKIERSSVVNAFYVTLLVHRD